MTGWVIGVEQKTSGMEGRGPDTGDYLNVGSSGVFSGWGVWEYVLGTLTSSAAEHIQVQTLLYSFYICIVP